MGRFTIFSLDGCPHCTRTKNLFNQYGIPYTEINLSKYPHRREDMMSLSGRAGVPQVFLNETHIGGEKEAIKLLQGWAMDEDWSPKEQYQNFVLQAKEPRDPRLQPATGPPPKPFQPEGVAIGPPPIRDKRHVISLPNENRLMTILEMTEMLKSILPCRDLKHNLTVYKQAFKASEFIDALVGIFTLPRPDALEFGRDVLQQKFGLLNHVVDTHALRDTPNLFFRLTCHQRPNILNSYRAKWTERVDPDPLRLLRTLSNQLDEILALHTNPQGRINYIAAYKDPQFPAFEEASCELQGVDMGHMNERVKKAFCINLYNFMIKFAFCKVGIGTTDTSRYSFFNQVQFQVGPHAFSFQELENGILRGNRKAPYALSVPFHPTKDIRTCLKIKEVDCRIHFALNCGASSCPPVKIFTTNAIDEELQIVAQAFCEENVEIANNELTISKIFQWYQEDFGKDPKELLNTIAKFVGGKKQVELQSLLSLGVTPKIKYAAYDWSSNASAFVPFTGDNVKAKSSRFLS